MTADNANRTRARLLVNLFPGIHLRELQRSMHVSFSSARYHVDSLSKSGEIERYDETGYSRLYPPGISESEKAVYSSTRNRTKRMILSILIETPNLTNKQLSEVTGLARSTVSQQIQSLLDSGIVRESVSTHSGTTYSVRDPSKVSTALSKSGHNIMSEAAERFVDLWDF